MAKKNQKQETGLTLSLRGRTFTGTVVSNKMQKTAVIEMVRTIKIPKYERYIQRKKRISVHVPEDIKVEKGDLVKVMETRPISKTKNCMVIENLGFQKAHIIKEDQKDDADQSVHKKKNEEADNNEEIEEKAE